MQTTCPECRTVFLISQEQLGLRRGLVRCGKCNAVFNAYDTLLAELRDAPASSAPAAPPIQDALAVPDAHRGEAPAAPVAAAAAGEPLAEPPASPPSPPPMPEAAPREESAEAILLSELPNRKPATPPQPVWKTLLFGLLAGVLLLLLAAQLAYFLRAPLVAAWPATRPALERACRWLGCEVPLPRQLAQEAIAAAHLEHDPEQKSRVRLTFLLVNRSGQTQAWPHIALTLTDVREQAVARKLFAPAAYLPPGTRLAAGMAAGAEREVRLELEIGNLAATGFALSPLYP